MDHLEDNYSHNPYKEKKPHNPYQENAGFSSTSHNKAKNLLGVSKMNESQKGYNFPENETFEEKFENLSGNK